MQVPASYERQAGTLQVMHVNRFPAGRARQAVTLPDRHVMQVLARVSSR